MRKLTGFILAILLLSVIGYGLQTVNAAVPHLINYQGRLTDTSGKPLDGLYNITFRIYDAETADNLLWQGTYNDVPITKGIFNVLLGDANDTGFNFSNLTFDKPYWLEIKVGEDAPMTTRQRITAAGYAISADNGVPRGAVIMWTGTIANIPPGWALCDGSNGTPDLRDKFIVGARQDDSGVVKTNVSGDLTQAGGEARHILTIAEMPAHSHQYSKDGTQTDYNDLPWPANNNDGKFVSTATSSTGGGEAHNILPPYYAVAFIMKL